MPSCKKKSSPIGPSASQVLKKELKKDPKLKIEIQGAQEKRIRRLIADMISNARKRGGLTQTEVAERAHMWPAHISRMESKKDMREPSISAIARVAKAMGYRLDLRLVTLKKTG